MQLVFQLQFFFKSPISFFNCCLFQRIWILLYTKVILWTYVWALIKVLDKTILNTICGQFTRCKRESVFLWKWILWCYRITSCRFCSFLLILQKWFQVFFQLTVYLVSSIFDFLWSYEWKKIILVFFFSSFYIWSYYMLIFCFRSLKFLKSSNNILFPIFLLSYSYFSSYAIYYKNSFSCAL